jgi:P2-related tail formation protein
MDRMEKRDGIWKITFRVGITDWMRTDPPTSQGYFGTAADLRPQQSREDMVYRRRSAFARPSGS